MKSNLEVAKDLADRFMDVELLARRSGSALHRKVIGIIM